MPLAHKKPRGLSKRWGENGMRPRKETMVESYSGGREDSRCAPSLDVTYEGQEGVLG